MIDALRYPFDSDFIMRKRKSLLQQLEAEGGDMISKRVAVLGGSTTSDIVKVLNLFLLNERIRAKFYESEYNKYWEDASFSTPSLDALEPEIVIFHTSTRNIRRFPALSDSPDVVDGLLESTFQHFRSAWESIQQRHPCIIIQNNFELPSYRLLGNVDAIDIHGKVSFINRLNERFAIYAREHQNFFINDINYLSACYGLDKWSDPFYWYMYKYSLCVPAIPELAYNLARIIKAICGRNKKALALDLDNTLWGGVIGDDGVEHIEIGKENATAEAYSAFQAYIKEQAELGVILNICSKNEESNALAGLNHQDSVLRAEDFVRIKANWDPKHFNLQQIAHELSILPEALVFVDDNPVEREIVHKWNPEVGIPELSRVEQYIREVDRAGFFEVTNLSADDLSRSRMYHENLQREAAKQTFVDYHDFLLSLKMCSEIHAFDEMNIARITQLTNKSNQFNLTTKRLTQTELSTIATDPAYISLYGRLIDKFGDNGIVSVVLGQLESDICRIELWLMSCRVLKRGMEDAMLDELVRCSLQRGIKKLQGIYIPSNKNAMVKNFYAEMGFTQTDVKKNGTTVWELVIGSDYTQKNSVMKVNNNDRQ